MRSKSPESLIYLYWICNILVKNRIESHGSPSTLSESKNGQISAGSHGNLLTSSIWNTFWNRSHENPLILAELKGFDAI